MFSKSSCYQSINKLPHSVHAPSPLYLARSTAGQRASCAVIPVIVALDYRAWQAMIHPDPSNSSALPAGSLSVGCTFTLKTRIGTICFWHSTYNAFRLYCLSVPTIFSRLYAVPTMVCLLYGTKQTAWKPDFCVQGLQLHAAAETKPGKASCTQGSAKWLACPVCDPHFRPESSCKHPSVPNSETYDTFQISLSAASCDTLPHSQEGLKLSTMHIAFLEGLVTIGYKCILEMIS